MRGIGAGYADPGAKAPGRGIHRVPGSGNRVQGARMTKGGDGLSQVVSVKLKPIPGISRFPVEFQYPAGHKYRQS